MKVKVKTMTGQNYLIEPPLSKTIVLLLDLQMEVQFYISGDDTH